MVSKLSKVVFGPLVNKQGTRGNHSLSKQHVPKSTYQKKNTSTPMSNAFYALEEDNGKCMDDLDGDTKKKVDAPSWNTGGRGSGASECSSKNG
ncbi:hypothetical protein Tco_1117023 [Tanacetum coccineum]